MHEAPNDKTVFNNQSFNHYHASLLNVQKPAFRLKKNPNKQSLEDKYQKTIQRIQEKSLDHSGLLEKSGWAKMKSPKPHLEIDAFKINKIVVGPNYVDRNSFLRGQKD